VLEKGDQSSGASNYQRVLTSKTCREPAICEKNSRAKKILTFAQLVSFHLKGKGKGASARSALGEAKRARSQKSIERHTELTIAFSDSVSHPKYVRQDSRKGAKRINGQNVK